MGAIAVLGVLAGCGSGDSGTSASTSTPEPAATTAAPATPTAEPFEKGHSRAVREYYGGGEAPVPPEADIEAEYHQPPRPATGGIGDTITLTGTNVGVRLRATVTGVDDQVTAARPPRAGTRYVGVDLRLESTGIAVHDSPLQNALLHYGSGKEAPPVLGVEAGCSNGFDGTVRIDVDGRARGCLLFEVPESARPRELLLALETVPAEAGGRWRLR